MRCTDWQDNIICQYYGSKNHMTADCTAEDLIRFKTTWLGLEKDYAIVLFKYYASSTFAFEQGSFEYKHRLYYAGPSYVDFVLMISPCA